MSDRDYFHLQRGFPPPPGPPMPHQLSVRVRCLNTWPGVVGVCLMSMNYKMTQDVPLT